PLPPSPPSRFPRPPLSSSPLPYTTLFRSPLVAADTHRDAMAFWMYSSGSTGRPKGVVHLQHDALYTCLAYGRGVIGVAESDIVLDRKSTRLNSSHGSVSYAVLSWQKHNDM